MFLVSPKAFFKETNEGILFYPAGALGRGFVVDIYKAKLIENTISATYRQIAFALLIFVVLDTAAELDVALLVQAVLAALIVFVYRVRIKDLLVDARPARTRLTRSELAENRVRHLRVGRLLRLIVTSVIMAVGATAAFVIALPDAGWLGATPLALSGLFFFGSTILFVGLFRRWLKYRATVEGEGGVGRF